MKSIHIPLVEGNEGDVILTTEAIYECNLPFTVSVVKDGWKAIQLSTKKGKYADAGLPDLVIPDINPPKLNGIEVLKNIKTSEGTKHIPVIMGSTSTFEKDIKLCRQLTRIKKLCV
jgi:CheY-like chemotaxis protein